MELWSRSDRPTPAKGQRVKPLEFRHLAGVVAAAAMHSTRVSAASTIIRFGSDAQQLPHLSEDERQQLRFRVVGQRLVDRLSYEAHPIDNAFQAHLVHVLSDDRPAAAG